MHCPAGRRVFMTIATGPRWALLCALVCVSLCRHVSADVQTSRTRIYSVCTMAQPGRTDPFGGRLPPTSAQSYTRWGIFGSPFWRRPLASLSRGDCPFASPLTPRVIQMCPQMCARATSLANCVFRWGIGVRYVRATAYACAFRRVLAIRTI